MLTAGDEVCRTQRGNNNAYCTDDETVWQPWELASWQEDLLAWTRALLDLRREHPVLRHDDFFEGSPAHADGTKDLAWFAADGVEMSPERWFDHDLGYLGMYLAAKPHRDGDRAPGSARSLFVLLNTGPHDVTVQLPGLPWGSAYDVLLDTADERPTPGPRHPGGGELTVLARSAQVLAAHP